MKNKDKKKQKKKDKIRIHSVVEIQAENQGLKQSIKKLEAELNKRERKIENLTRQLKELKASKNKKGKPGKSAARALLAQQKTRVAVAQRKAWKRHGYLRDRYEFHLGNGQDKTNARIFADKDLREAFGDDAGYSEQELEQILS